MEASAQASLANQKAALEASNAKSLSELRDELELEKKAAIDTLMLENTQHIQAMQEKMERELQDKCSQYETDKEMSQTKLVEKYEERLKQSLQQEDQYTTVIAQLKEELDSVANKHAEGSSAHETEISALNQLLQEKNEEVEMMKQKHEEEINHLDEKHRQDLEAHELALR